MGAPSASGCEKWVGRRLARQRMWPGLSKLPFKPKTRKIPIGISIKRGKIHLRETFIGIRHHRRLHLNYISLCLRTFSDWAGVHHPNTLPNECAGGK